jgi:hypothetical protein
MIKSANQLYKESKSTLPFKEWLRIEQEKGNLQNCEKMYNASGNNDEINYMAKNTKASRIRMTNVVGLLSLGMIAYGIYQETKN